MDDRSGEDGPGGRSRWGWAGVVGLLVVLVGVGLLVREGQRADDRTLSAVGGAPPATTTPTAPPPTRLTEPGAAATTTSAPTPPTTASVSDPLDPEDRVSLEGVGPVRVGMTLEEASAAAGQGISEVPGSGAGADPAACYYAVPDTGEPKVSFLVLDGEIARVDVEEGSAARTISGIGIGVPEADVLATYGDRIVVEPDPDGGAGKHLRYVADDPARSLVFETDGAKVLRFRSGDADAVRRAEGCA